MSAKDLPKVYHLSPSSHCSEVFTDQYWKITKLGKVQDSLPYPDRREYPP